MILDNMSNSTTATEAPVSPQPDGPPATVPMPPQNTSLIRFILVFAGFVAGFCSCALLFAIIWWVVATQGNPSPRNSPEALFSAPSSIKQQTITPDLMPNKALGAADLNFGEQQVERMVNDRPEMRRYV